MVIREEEDDVRAILAGKIEEGAERECPENEGKTVEWEAGLHDLQEWGRSDPRQVFGRVHFMGIVRAFMPFFCRTTGTRTEV